MFKTDLKEKYPFLTNYFEEVIKNNISRIPHGIIFYGQDIVSQYDIALELARLLNCKEDKNEDCQCLNCRWAKEKKHPSILTITNIDSKPQNDDSKTVISIKQTQMIKSSLTTASDNYRVFIFCGAKLINEVWTPTGLNFENFKAEAANSLLKIVEEAPQKSVFIFLTNDKSDIISTIVSRSQVFFVPSFNRESLNFQGTKDIFEDYPDYEPAKLFEYSAMLQNYIKNYENFFDKCQNYLLELLKSNTTNAGNKIINDIKLFERAKKMYTLGMKPEIIADDLFLGLMGK